VIKYPDAILNSWLPVAAVQELTAKPLARQLHGIPIVIFRSADGIAVMRDRCPHRNVPLSEGRVKDGQIVCPYHGWAFAGNGSCKIAPGCMQLPNVTTEVLAVHVAGGMIFTTTARDPLSLPQLPEPLDSPGMDHFIWPIRFRSTLVDGIENLLDPAHPHYLHPGIVRSGKERNLVKVELREQPAMVEAIYEENVRPKAWMPRLLEGKRARSVGRFFPPTTAQLAFESDTGPKLVITAFFAPETLHDMIVFAHFSTPKGRLPAWIKEFALRAFHRPVLAQDRAILMKQLDNLGRFGAPRYAAGPLDFLKPGIVKLMQGETLVPSIKNFECFL
jgi:phenylpropionate dioxygenase-like ring-hydroxylating dioxygenase large terminal subunit